MHAGKGMLSPKADAYGGLVYAHYKGLPSTEIIERDAPAIRARHAAAEETFEP